MLEFLFIPLLHKIISFVQNHNTPYYFICAKLKLLT